MKPLAKSLILFVAVAFYSFLYLATSYEVKCEDDCQKTNELYRLLANNRKYVFSVSRCLPTYSTDTLCIGVRDTTGINWTLFADTVCAYASSVNLPRQTIFILNKDVFPNDTLARKQCP